MLIADVASGYSIRHGSPWGWRSNDIEGTWVLECPVGQSCPQKNGLLTLELWCKRGKSRYFWAGTVWHNNSQSRDLGSHSEFKFQLCHKTAEQLGAGPSTTLCLCSLICIIREITGSFSRGSWEE